MMTRRQLEKLRRELEWHCERHPSQRWEAKLEVVNLILNENEAELELISAKIDQFSSNQAGQGARP